MSVEIAPLKQPVWTPLPYEGCLNVTYKSLLKSEQVALAMLRFDHNATILASMR